jgi:adenosine deaminase
MSVIKAELHTHLEGTISPALAHTLAERNKLQLPDGLISADGSSYLSNDFLHFLSVYDTVADLIRTPQDYYDITFDYLKSCAAGGAIYVEMMYSPDHAEKASDIPSIEHLQVIQQACDDAEAKFGIVGRIIITAVRHLGSDAAIKVAKAAATSSVPCATGFGLGGDEINFPPGLFKRAYEIAATEAGLECTVHAGEFAPASGMVEAMDNLPIKRIGHGVQVMHSPETMAMVKDRGIALELCPSSNIKLGLFKNLAEHPFPKLYEDGFIISINSDDPPFFSTNLKREYDIVQDAWRYSDEQMNGITKMAIDMAFVDEDTRKRLYAKL